jgi:DNA-directed RNA polymerase specialized sigma24 family protein
MVQNYLERVRGVLGASALPDLDRLDRQNEHDLNRAAEALVERFREQDDAEAFHVLVDLTADPLAQRATAIARDLGLAEDSDRLVINALERMFVDLRPSADPCSSFLSDTTYRMREDAEAWIRDIALSSVHEPDDAVAWDARRYEPLAALSDPATRAKRICFHRMDAVLRQVLRARDIDGMPTSEIAERLAVPYGRAESLLVEASKRLQWAVDCAVRRSGRASVPSTAPVTAPVTDAGQALAGLAYELARRCCFIGVEERHEEDAFQRVRWDVRPVDVSRLRRQMAELLTHEDLPVDLSSLPPGDPSPAGAVTCGQRAVDLCESLEGGTTRAAFMRAHLAGTAQNFEEQAERCAHMLATDLSLRWRGLVTASLQTALIGLGRFREVVDLGQPLIERNPAESDAAFNTLTAQAWMRQDAQLEASMKRFRHSLVGVPDPEYWAGVLTEDAPWIAEQMGRDLDDILRSMAPPGY